MVYPVLSHSGLRAGWRGLLGGGDLARKPAGQAWGAAWVSPAHHLLSVTATAVQVPVTQQTPF